MDSFSMRHSPDGNTSAMTHNNQKSATGLWAALAAAFLLSLWIQAPRLADPYTVEEDMRSFAWLHRLHEPEILAGDLLWNREISDLHIGRATIPIYRSSPGYSLLIWLGSFLVEPILFTKLLIFPLLFVSVYYLYRIGLGIAGPGRALAVCMAYILFNLASSTAISATGGLQRSFMLPLLLALIYYLMVGRYWPAATVILISSTIYPPAAFLGAVTYGLSLLTREPGKRLPAIRREGFVPLIVAVGLVALLLLPTLMAQLDRAAMGTASGSPMSLLANPTYQSGGRRELFTSYPLVGRAGITTNMINLLHLLFFSVATLITFRLQPKSLSRLPGVLKLLFAASFVCFAAAWAGMLITSSFPLYLPSRYTQASLPLVLLIYVILNEPETLHRFTAWLHRQRGRIFLFLVPVSLFTAAVALFGPELHTDPALPSILRYRETLLLLLSAALLLLGLALAFGERNSKEAFQTDKGAQRLACRAPLLFGLVLLLPALTYVWAFHADFYIAQPHMRQVYRFLDTLPRDARIAGDPQALSSVPIFARRAVLFSEEVPHPDGDVIMDAMQAYYSSSLQEVAAFCRRQAVDYLLVNRDDFSRWRVRTGQYIFEPYDSLLQTQLANRTSFALAEAGHENRLFEAGNLYVVSCPGLVPGTGRDD